jgi:cystathionine beta-lyase
MSNIFIKNKELKRKFAKEYAKTGLSQPPLVGIISSKAAYEHGREWKNELLKYLSNNIDTAMKFAENSDILRDKLVFYKKQGTFLSWVDFSNLNIKDEVFYEKLLKTGKVWVSLGSQYGAGGEGHFRLNLGTNTKNVIDAMQRIEKTVSSLV